MDVDDRWWLAFTERDDDPPRHDGRHRYNTFGAERAKSGTPEQ
jgi:hypothetical protein